MIALASAVVVLHLLANAKGLEDGRGAPPSNRLTRWAFRRLEIRSPSGRY